MPPITVVKTTIALALICLIAFLLRTIGTNVPLDSNDYVRLAYDSTYNWGWYWCFQINYGPLHPALTKATAVIVTGLGLPMTETLWRLPLILAGTALPIVTFLLVRRLVNSHELRSHCADATSTASAQSTPSPLQGEGRGKGSSETLAASASTSPMSFNEKQLTCFNHHVLEPPSHRSSQRENSPTQSSSNSAVQTLASNATTAARLAPWAAALWVAVLPPFVADARYPWGYESLGVFCAVLSLLMLARYLHRPNRWRAWGAGSACALYLWSHLFIYALPLVWLCWIGASASWQRRQIWLLIRRVGLWLPPFAAMALTVMMHLRFGGGPLARFAYKAEITETVFRGWNAPLGLLQDWFGHFGYAMTGIVLLAMFAGAKSAFRPKRRDMALWWWPVLFAVPYFTLMCYQAPPGRSSPYLAQGSLALILLTATVLVPMIVRRWGVTVARKLIVVSTCLLAFGTIDTNLLGNRYTSLTGVRADWGAARPNRGYRAMGWYVQSYVPDEAVVFTFHEFDGLELLPATFYCGRRVLAYCDMTAQQNMKLFGAYIDKIDVIVLERRLGITKNFADDFEKVATVTQDGIVLLVILARRDRELPMMRLPVEQYDAEYHRAFATRVPGKPPSISARLPTYQDVDTCAMSIYKENPQPQFFAKTELSD